jgi:hypothetical protein
LTQFELKNPRFKGNAGAAAFQAGILQSSNPYKGKHERETWDKGYRAAKKFYETGRPIQSDKPRHSAWKRPTSPTGHTGHTGFTDKRIGQFNNRFRTAA